MDDSIKEKLLDRFRAYLDTVDGEPEPPDQTGEGTDLFSVFVELAALRSEVRTESRLVKEALDQFRSVFDTLQASHGTMEQELKRAQAEALEQSRSVLRPLLLDVIDIRDRLVAGLKLPQASPDTLARPLLAPQCAGGGRLAGGGAHDFAARRSALVGAAHRAGRACWPAFRSPPRLRRRHRAGRFGRGRHRHR